jgi:hypothetical protein
MAQKRSPITQSSTRSRLVTSAILPVNIGKRQAETIRQRTVFSCYHQGKGCGRMTAKAESPPVNGNEMKVLRRTLWIWPNGASVLGCVFITDERDINGILMIPNRHQDFRNRRFLVPSAGIVLRTAVTRLSPGSHVRPRGTPRFGHLMGSLYAAESDSVGPLALAHAQQALERCETSFGPSDPALQVPHHGIHHQKEPREMWAINRKGRSP